MVVQRGVYANRRFRIGMSDFGGQPLHSKVVSWEHKLPETFWGTQKTPCYVHVYILYIMKQSVESLMTARFAIEGVLKSYF